MNLYTNIITTGVLITVEYNIAPGVSRGILNTSVAIVSKIPTDQQRFFIITIPKFRDEIFSEHIRNLRKRFKTDTATILLTKLYKLAFIRNTTTLIFNSHTDIICSYVGIRMTN